MAVQVPEDGLTLLRTPYFEKALPFIFSSTKTHAINPSNKNHTITVVAKLDTNLLPRERFVYEISVPLGDLNWVFLVYPFGVIGNKENIASAFLRLQSSSRISEESVPAEFSFDSAKFFTRCFMINDVWGIQEWKNIESVPSISISFSVQVNANFIKRKDRTPSGKGWPLIEWSSVSELIFSKPGDITIQGSDWKYIVHKDIICKRSEYFNAAFSYDTIEANKNEIVIPDVDGEVMRAILEFIYFGRINNLSDIVDRLYVTAEKYCLNDLETLCIDYLSSSINETNVIEKLSLAETHNCKILKDTCFSFIKTNLKQIMDDKGWKELNQSPDIAFQVADFLGKLLISK